MLSVAVLTKVDPLPRPQLQAPIFHGNGHAAAEQGGFDVGGHVIGAFGVVNVVPRLRRNVLKEVFQILLHIGIGVFVNQQRRLRVAAIDGEQAGLHALLCRPRTDFGRDLDETLPRCRYLERALKLTHQPVSPPAILVMRRTHQCLMSPNF